MPARLLPFRRPQGTPRAPGKDPLAGLARSCVQGDVRATRTLIVSVMPALLRAARGVLGVRHGDVEDVAQEAALGLVQSLATFRSESTVLHYATRIGVRTALAARRKAKVRGEGRHVELDESAVSTEQSPAALLLSAYRRQILRELCDELPEAQSEALVLHCVMGLSLEEVAAVSGAPENTVRSRLRLAKESLRSKILGDGRLREALTSEVLV
jgi:RNA polymerase sigma factor (sigma-70 family)